MSVVINTNVDALKIQNVLTNSTNKLSQTMQRMSSGLRINSAKDDAAGTVISARMQVQLDGNKICQNNVQNANSMLSTAEGNVDVVLENVSRIRDLTLQAKNGTYSESEKEALQQEVDERIREINRVSDSAKFSQLQLFGGQLADEGITFQVGANATTNDTISIDAEKGVFKSVNFYDLLTKTTPAQDAVDYPDSVTSIQNNKTAIDALAVEDNVNNVYYNKGDKKFYQIQEDGDSYVAKETKLDADELETLTGDTAPTTSTTGVAGKVYHQEATDKYYICTQHTDAVADPETPASNTWVELDASQFATDIDATEKSTTNPYSEGTFDLSKMTAGEAETSGTFAEAISALDEAIDNLTARKSAIGSAQNRLFSALDTLTTQYTNLSSAKSIITDADIASEASQFTQNQILQQVSTSLLAQANQAPSIALSLL